MIGRDEPMALVVQMRRHKNIVYICYLGHATMDANEMHRIDTLASKQGCFAFTTVVSTLVEGGFITPSSFAQVYAELEKAIG